MPYTAVVPVATTVITPPAQMSFSAPPGLQSIPASLQPEKDGLSPSSFPTPLGLLEATTLALKQDWQEPLSTASQLLLQALVAGTVEFKWVSLDRITSPTLRSVLNAYVGDQIGLISRNNQVVGYLTRELIPTLAGPFVPDVLANAGQLRPLLGIGTDFPVGQVAAVLDAIKQGVSRSGPWTPHIPWMRLVDRAIEGTVITPVNLQLDIRSVGPFNVPLTVDGGQRLDLYLLALAPNFVTSLAALTAGQIQPPAQGGARFTCTAGTATATFDLHHGHTAAAIDLSEGNATIVGSPPTNVDTSRIGTSHAMTMLGTHLQALKARVGTLSDAVVAEPWRLSDVGRLLALFAPDGQSPMKFSPAWATFARKQTTPLLLTAPAVQSLAQRGLAFVLEPEDGAQRPSLAFIEVLPRTDGGSSVVGDLSALGLALYVAFSGGRLVPGFGFADDDGQPLFDTGHSDFPLTHPDPLGAWWTTGHRIGPCASSPVVAALQVATIQRFLRTCADKTPSQQPFDQLAAAAATAFARRVLGATAADHLMLPGAGAIATAAPTLVPLDGYGTLQVWRDAFR